MRFISSQRKSVRKSPDPLHMPDNNENVNEISPIDGSADRDNSDEQGVFLADCDETVSHEQNDNFDKRGSSVRGEDEALRSLLISLLRVTYKWSVQHGYESVPPGVLLRQVCTMIDAIEIAFTDENQ